MTTAFAWWERQEPTTFLQHDWHNPSRAVGAAWAIESAGHGGVILEVGPGSGVDYQTHFRPEVLDGRVGYIGSEPTTRFRSDLARRFPEVAWWDRAITDLGERVATVTYARAVLEHQPALDPALTALLKAASRACIVDWYRPPAAESTVTFHDGVHYNTYALWSVRAAVHRVGWEIADIHTAASGNQVWRMETLAP